MLWVQDLKGTVSLISWLLSSCSPVGLVLVLVIVLVVLAIVVVVVVVVIAVVLVAVVLVVVVGVGVLVAFLLGCQQMIVVRSLVRLPP